MHGIMQQPQKGFAMMLLGFAVTALVRLLLGEAHHF